MHANNATRTTPCVGATNVRPPPSDVGSAVVVDVEVVAPKESAEAGSTVVVSDPDPIADSMCVRSVRTMVDNIMRIN